MEASQRLAGCRCDRSQVRRPRRAAESAGSREHGVITFVARVNFRMVTQGKRQAIQTTKTNEGGARDGKASYKKKQ